ncbi:RraA family protein [Mycolicibacterium septicum DSM 44393]|uniref:Putative 4-hydroxy-4-methyl-2-oxoglutarate aldolase n=1 Tax=Mycolicibacterium septicum DSM 44393 TaxID=1341646 RepID=A0A7X6MMA5_9MYCO|nr:dimethylmenaquinone methyltransferase [Mycolicibacterium septicum]NKZ10774.1 RraA family protein [Mycolicibacterium septicum DSM 44393]
MFTRFASPPVLDPAISAALGSVTTSTFGHLRDHGFIRGLTPLAYPAGFVGVAITVQIPYMDSTAVHVAVDELRQGDVLVVQQSGDRTRSCFGGVLAFTARHRGAAGAVFDGPVNDRQQILDEGFPVYSRGVAPITTRILGIEGQINVPVSISGTVVNPGDIIWADNDGIVVLGPAEALDAARLTAEMESGEDAFRHHLQRGGSLAAHSGARDLFNARRAPLVEESP